MKEVNKLRGNSRILNLDIDDQNDEQFDETNEIKDNLIRLIKRDNSAFFF